LLDVFLPAGYPQSVSSDYIEYQIYDSLQAFSSSIAGLLSARAVLEGVGVGDANATPTAALLLNVVQESMGRIATIVFAHRLGTALEPECKTYRFAADIFNDTAMILDCLSPAFPKYARVVVLSFSSALRALCAVAAGSSKATLSAHFALRGNLGELNAKDSSQETVISLLGMLVGSLVVSRITTKTTTWLTLLILLTTHLAMNYAAVRAVSMRSLNRQRANLVLSYLIEDGEVLAPQEVARKERIFERDGALRWKNHAIIGNCKIGVSFHTILRCLGDSHERTGSIQVHQKEIATLMEIFEREEYVLWYDEMHSSAYIVLKNGCSADTHLKAWTHALHVAWRASRHLSMDGKKPRDASLGCFEILSDLRTTLKETSIEFADYARQLKEAGWDLDIAALETSSGCRLELGKIDSRSIGPEAMHELRKD
ncbi:DUF647-domain-containing protein, partial [Patellaria atrata CBS 101060]